MDCSHTYFHTARIAFSSDICWNGWLSCCQDNDKDNFLAKWRVPAEEAWREVHWSVRCSEAPRNGFLVARGARDSISALWQKGDGVLKPDRQAVLLCFVSPEFPKLWGLMKKMRSKSMTQHVMFFFLSSSGSIKSDSMLLNFQQDTVAQGCVERFGCGFARDWRWLDLGSLGHGADTEDRVQCRFWLVCVVLALRLKVVGLSMHVSPWWDRLPHFGDTGLYSWRMHTQIWRTKWRPHQQPKTRRLIGIQWRINIPGTILGFDGTGGVKPALARPLAILAGP